MDEHTRFYTTGSFANIDLHSCSATRAPKFDFSLAKDEESPISLLRCHYPHETCMSIKHSFQVSWNKDPHLSPPPPGTVRVEYLALDELAEGKEGWMLLAEDAAFLEGNRQLPVTITAIIIPNDNKVRWSYHLLSVTEMLRDLDERKLCSLHSHWPPGTRNHRRFTAYIRENFLAAVEVPHAPDYLNAIQITDCCPSIVEPEDALQRLEANELLYFAHKNPLESCLDLQDDRYLLYLEPAEREVASIAGFRCAEYLFIKRNFFRVLYEKIYRSEKNIGGDDVIVNDASASRPQKSFKGQNNSGLEAIVETDEEDERQKEDTSEAIAAAAEESDTFTMRSGRVIQTRTPPPARLPQTNIEGCKGNLATRANRKIRASIPKPNTARRMTKASGIPASRADTPLAANNTTSNARHSAVWQSAEGTVRTRVRTDTGHQHWLEQEYGMRGQRAKLMVAAWRELGFLDERRFLPWAKAGGIGLCQRGEG